MPTATAAEKRPLMPAGEHILALVSVEEKEFPSYNDPEKMEPRWIWQFKSKATDPETGDHYEFRQYTGPRYGNSKAALTLLLDQMCPTWSEEQKSTIDTDDLLQKYFKGRIVHVKSDQPNGDPKAKLAFIEPHKTPAKKVVASAPVAPVADANEDEDPEGFDPFAGAE